MKKVFLFLLVCCAEYALYAQYTQVDNCPSLTGDRSLIIDSYDTLPITYSETPPYNQGVFMVKLPIYPTGRLVELPIEIKVNDIDFYCENLMYGGCFEKNGVKQGVLGRLYVPNSFDWGQDMEYVVLDWMHEFGGVKSILITNVKRIAEIREPISCLSYFRFACVADCMVAENGDTNEATALCDVMYDNGAWNVYVYVNSDDNITYSDIAVSDNLVMAVGVNNLSYNMHMNVFKRTLPFVSYSLINGIGYEIVDEMYGEKALVTSMTNDRFAIANHYMSVSEAGNTVLLVDCADGYPAMINASHQVQNTIPMIDKSWDLREIKYDQSSHLLYLLQWMDYPISPLLETVVNEYDVLNFSAGFSLSSWIPNFKSYGLNLWRYSGFQTIGVDGSQMTMYRKHGGYLPTQCAEHVMSSYYLVYPRIVDVEEKDTQVRETYRSVSFYPTPDNAPIYNECEEL